MWVIKIWAAILICLCIDLDLMCIIAKDTLMVTKLIVMFFATSGAILIYTYLFV